MKHLFGFIAVAICLVLVGTSANAQKTWDGSSSSVWSTAANWTPSGAPGAGDDVIIDIDAAILVDVSPTINSLTISGSATVSLTSSGGGRTITIDNSGSSIGAGSTLTLQGSTGTGTRSMTIAFAAGGPHTMAIAGTLILTSVGEGTVYDATNSETTVTGTIRKTATGAATAGVVTSTAANMSFASGSRYEHGPDASSAVPTATWDANSTCAITNWDGSANVPTNLGQTFGHFELGPFSAGGGTTAALSTVDVTITCAGNFTADVAARTIALATGTGDDVTLDIAGNFSLVSGTLSMGTSTGTGSIFVAGDFSQTAGTTLTASGTGGRTITFDGSLDQSFSAGGTISGTISYTVNKATGALNLASSLNVPGGATLTMTSGNIVTGANILTLGTSAASVGTLAHTSGTIVGNFRRWISTTTGARLFPIGTASNYRPATVDFTVAPGTGGTLTARFETAGATGPGTSGLPFTTNPPDGTDPIPQTLDVISQPGVWRIESGDGFAGGTYSLSLVADGFPNISDEATLRIVKRPVGSDWALDGTYAANAAGPTINRIGMSGFSEFGIASSSLNNPLPVQLASFTGAVIENNRVRLNWRTISEVNNYGFYVQKRAAGITSWTELGFVAGHGTTNEPQNYTYTDNAGITGTTQYRLKQVDFDGTTFFTEPILVDLPTSVPEVAPKQFALMQNYPNPFNPSTEIKFSVENTGHATLVVYNSLGQQVATLFDAVAEAGRYNVVQFNATGLSSGVYFYRLQSGQKSELKKLMLLK